MRRYGANDPSAAVLHGADTFIGALTDAAPTDATYSGQNGRATRSWASPAAISARLAGAEILPLVQQLAENSVILTEVHQRLPARVHRHDASGRLRPALFAPERVLQQIARQAHEREQQRLRPGSRVSATQLTVPVSSATQLTVPVSSATQLTVPVSSVRGDNLLAMTTEATWQLSIAVPPRFGAALGPHAEGINSD